MKKGLITLLLLAFVVGAMGKSPKYVFYFIGDGMGPSQIGRAHV